MTRRNQVREGIKRLLTARNIFALFFIVVLYQVVTLPSGLEYATEIPSKTPIMEARDQEARWSGKKGFTLRYQWTPIGKVAPQLARAIIAAEDSRYFQHSGFDWTEAYKAISSSIRSLTFPRGASTITQQLAKNLYLSEAKTPVRKLKEYVITRRLEQNLSKRRILELYLNVIEWGPGIFGVKAAASYYFGKVPAALSPSDCAFLAAIIPNPRTVFNPKLHPKRVSNRQRLILKRMNGVTLPSAYYQGKQSRSR